MNVRRSSLLIVPALALTLLACDDPAADKPKATISSASPAATVAATSTAAATALAAPAPFVAPVGPAGSFPLDASASSLSFVGSKVTGNHTGNFGKLAGWIALEGGKAEGGKAAFAIDLASAKTDQDKLDGHLKSPDFFDVAKYPTSTFTTTQIKAGGDKGATHTITGDLDLHGVRKSISFPATIKLAADAVTATAEFSINRKDFNVVYPGMANDLIKDDVLIKLSLKAPIKK